MMKVGLHDETNEVKVARFVNDFKRDIQDIVELYEHSSLENVLHLALKIEVQLKRKNWGARKSYLQNDY